MQRIIQIGELRVEWRSWVKACQNERAAGAGSLTTGRRFDSRRSKRIHDLVGSFIGRVGQRLHLAGLLGFDRRKRMVDGIEQSGLVDLGFRLVVTWRRLLRR